MADLPSTQGMFPSYLLDGIVEKKLKSMKEWHKRMGDEKETGTKGGTRIQNFGGLDETPFYMDREHGDAYVDPREYNPALWDFTMKRTRAFLDNPTADRVEEIFGDPGADLFDENNVIRAFEYFWRQTQKVS